MWFKINNFFTRLLHWEFWPYYITYLPLPGVYAWYAMLSRDFLFFLYLNPSMLNSGLTGEPKHEIYDNLPAKYLPFTQLLPKGTSYKTIQQLMQQQHLHYPVVLKPNIGERGYKVNIVRHDEELQQVVTLFEKEDFILQDYIDYPIESNIYYYRLPTEKKGHIFSCVSKEYPHVIGDGQSTLEELILQHPRQSLYIDYHKHHLKDTLQKVIPKDEKFVYYNIGSHCRGTEFINRKDCITESLEAFFDEICDQTADFYYGRFDFKCESLETLGEDKKMLIIELNGVGAEATHTMSRGGCNYWEALGVFVKQIQSVYVISKQNKHSKRYTVTWKERVMCVMEMALFFKREF